MPYLERQFTLVAELAGILYEPVIRDIHNRLLTLIPDEFNFILHLQDRLGRRSIDLLLSRRVPHPRLDRPRISLIAILAKILEVQGGFSIPRDGQRPLPHMFVPPLFASMQRIGAVVGRERVFFAIQSLYDSVLDPVGEAADGCPEIGRVVVDVLFLSGEPLHDVVAIDAELLDDGAQGQECEGGCILGSHCVGSCETDVGNWQLCLREKD